jgi:hypothetical protein
MKLKIPLVVICALCAGIAAQDRVPVKTRTVLEFGGLERQLASSAAAANRGELLAEDFEERLCADPGTPIPRQDWLQQRAAEAGSGGVRFTDEAVHLLDDVAIYSGVRTADGATDTLVDVWKKQDSGWKLLVRYRCPSSGENPKAGIEKRY